MFFSQHQTILPVEARNSARPAPHRSRPVTIRLLVVVGLTLSLGGCFFPPPGWGYHHGYGGYGYSHHGW
jgi:hypothetical protein